MQLYLHDLLDPFLFTVSTQIYDFSDRDHGADLGLDRLEQFGGIRLRWAFPDLKTTHPSHP